MARKEIKSNIYAYRAYGKNIIFLLCAVVLAILGIVYIYYFLTSYNPVYSTIKLIDVLRLLLGVVFIFALLIACFGFVWRSKGLVINLNEQQIIVHNLFKTYVLDINKITNVQQVKTVFKNNLDRSSREQIGYMVAFYINKNKDFECEFEASEDDTLDIIEFLKENNIPNKKNRFFI